MLILKANVTLNLVCELSRYHAEATPDGAESAATLAQLTDAAVGSEVEEFTKVANLPEVEDEAPITADEAR